MSNASSITGEEKKENMVETFVKSEENEVVEDNVLDDSSQDLEIVETFESDSVENVANNEPEQEGEDEFEEDEYEEQEQPEPVEPELKLEPSSEASTEIGQSNVEISGEVNQVNQNEPKTEVKLEDSVEEIKPNLEQADTEDVIILDSKSPSPAFVRAQSQETEEFLDYEEDLLEDPLDEQLQDKDNETGKASGNSMSSSSVITSESKEASATSSDTAAKPSTPFAEEVKKTSIWIRGMAPSTKASSVKQLTSQYGKVIQSKIFNSRPINGEIKNCFALVTFAETQPMDMAIAGLHKKNYQGRVLRVEKVSESHLTNSAERIAKEKKVAEVKKEPAEETVQKEPSPKKRAIIMAPENTPPRKQPTPKTTPKKAVRQTIQAPKSAEKPNNTNKETTNQKPAKRPQIQAPPRSKSREAQPEKAATASKRKPITFDSPDRKSRELRSAEKERDSRRTITAAVPSNRVTRKVSPIRTASGRAGTQESLIISARVDTSNCRGGGATIKRSVERGIPNNISTSQLRRNQINAAQSSRRHVPQSPPPRASYQTEQYSREHADNHRRRHPSPPVVRDHYEYFEEEIYEEPPRGGGRRRRGGYEEQEPLRRRLHDEHVASTRQTRKEKEMLEALKRQEIEQMRIEMEREAERMKFEREKLERERLEVELQRQKFALEMAQRASMNAVASEDRDHRRGGGSSSARGGGDRDSRRRPAEDVLPSATPAKLHTNERASRDNRSGSSSQRRGDNQSGRHSTHSNNTSSSLSRHANTTYGIHSGIGQSSTRGTAPAAPINNDFMYGEQTRGNSHYSRGGAASNAFDTHSSLGEYQNYNGYSDNSGYQVWGGLDAQGNMAMDTNWTGATPSSSTSSGTNQWSSQQQSYGSNSSSSNNRRDYGYRNNY